jgi:hypothetical protein
MERKPDFFIVGAPRSGTTALASYLGQHPRIFMPGLQDIYYFGSDLPFFVERKISRESYLSIFQAARDGQEIGEASRWYLYSKRAAEEIHRFQPEARIIIMLRNPVDMMYSMHGHRLLLGAEDIPDFEAALDAEPRRKSTGDVPHHLGMRESVFYREIARYVPQVERYFRAFGRDRVHIIIFDDLASDTGNVYRETLRFLGVSQEFRPEFPVVNAYRRVRNPRFTRRLVRPPKWLLRIVTGSMSRSVQHYLFLRITNLLAVRALRPSMDPGLRHRLQAEFKPEIERLGGLIGRDLGIWTSDGACR